jgi:hypothetical protein
VRTLLLRRLVGGLLRLVLGRLVLRRLWGLVLRGLVLLRRLLVLGWLRRLPGTGRLGRLERGLLAHGHPIDE